MWFFSNLRATYAVATVTYANLRGSCNAQAKHFCNIFNLRDPHFEYLHPLVYSSMLIQELRRPLDAAQTVYFTVYYSLSRVLEELPRLEFPVTRGLLFHLRGSLLKSTHQNIKK